MLKIDKTLQLTFFISGTEMRKEIILSTTIRSLERKNKKVIDIVDSDCDDFDFSTNKIFLKFHFKKIWLTSYLNEINSS